MENKTIIDIPSALLLFEQFKTHFDQENKLTPPNATTNLVSIWNSLSTQLNIENL